MTSDGGDPRDVLAYLLKHAHLRLTALVDRGLAPLGIDGKDFGVLRVIATGQPKSQAEVAQTLSIDRTSMVARIDALEAKGIVSRRPDPVDRRRNVVELTESGHSTYAEAAEAYDAAERDLLTSLERAERQALSHHLRTILAN